MGRLAKLGLVVALVGGLVLLVPMIKAYAQSTGDERQPSWQDQLRGVPGQDVFS